MRYFVVTYLRKPNGQIDELVSLTKKIKTRDLQSAAVILDFSKQMVIKASLEGTTLPRDWQRIRDYYHQHYRDVVDQLEQNHNEK